MINLQSLYQSDLVDFPLTLRALSRRWSTEARLVKPGRIAVKENTFDDPDLAMQAVVGADYNSLSSGWQFWGWFDDTRDTWTPIEHLRVRLENQAIATETRTSLSHPLRIDYVQVGSTGKIGLTFCPGKRSSGLYGGIWERDLESDLQLIKAEGIQLIISLIEDHEFDQLKVPNFEESVKKTGLELLHLPIHDMSIPSEIFEFNWRQESPILHQMLTRGEKILIHCRGGLGRTGMVAARLLMESGISAQTAIKLVREARPNSIETFGQVEYLLDLRETILRKNV